MQTLGISFLSSKHLKAGKVGWSAACSSGGPDIAHTCAKHTCIENSFKKKLKKK